MQNTRSILKMNPKEKYMMESDANLNIFLIVSLSVSDEKVPSNATWSWSQAGKRSGGWSLLAAEDPARSP